MSYVTFKCLLRHGGLSMRVVFHPGLGVLSSSNVPSGFRAPIMQIVLVTSLFSFLSFYIY